MVLPKTSFPAAQQTPRVGLEPTGSNQQSADNTALTEKANSVLSTGLDKIVQACSELVKSEYLDLEQIIAAWPELPEHIKATIKVLIQTQNKL